MLTKCCIPNCKSNYASGSKCTVYTLPKDKKNAELWLRNLPSSIKSVSQFMGICAKHWPDNAPMITGKGFKRPLHPPTIFPTVPKSSLRLTEPTKSRNVDRRGVLLNNRAKLVDELVSFNAVDNIGSWFSFVEQSDKLTFVSNGGWLVQKNDSGVQFFIVTGRTVEVSVSVQSDFTVSAHRFNTPVSVSHLLGFQHRLGRFSQLEAVMNHTKQAEKTKSNELIAHAQSIQELCSGDSRQLFLARQLELSATQCQGVRYSSEDILTAAKLYFGGRGAYRTLRNYICLPHPDTLKRHLGGLGTVATDEDCRRLVTSHMEHSTPLQRCCCVIFDEVFVQPSLRFSGGHAIGFAEDAPDLLARTVLALMLKPLMGADPFVARLVPIYSLSPQFLHDQVVRLIRITHESGGRVLAAICDNHFTNKNCFEMFERREQDAPWQAVNPADHTQPLFLLYDTVHIMKNIRNNWFTQGHKEIDFLSAPGGVSARAKWNDLVAIEEKSRHHVLRPTSLSPVSCHPSPLECQKVQLVLDVFNDKTVAALRLYGLSDTADFVERVTDFWKIVNVKSPKSCSLLNDARRSPIFAPDSENLAYLSNFTGFIGRMPGGRGASRPRSLTTDTRNAIVQTAHGLVELSSYLLTNLGFSYVLLGELQSDRLEREFSIYRQGHGGCYFIAVDQILASARLRRMQIYNRLMENDQEHQTAECCSAEMTATDMDLLDHLPTKVERLTDEEQAALYYVSGYIAAKEDVSSHRRLCMSDETPEPADCHSEFASLLSRGKLVHPAEWIVIFAGLCYAYFCGTEYRCANRYTSAFIHIFDCYIDLNGLSLKSSVLSRISRRLANTFFKGLVRRNSEPLRDSGVTTRRLRKLKP